MRHKRDGSAGPTESDDERTIDDDTSWGDFARWFGRAEFAVVEKMMNERRAQLCNAGLDSLVRHGGLPWGICFGYERSTMAGFPVKHPLQAAAVKRAFDLGESLSASETADALGKENHLSPNGTTNWTAHMVRSIWQCSTYTGSIRYRKTRVRRDAYTGMTVSCLRAPEDQIVGYNPSLRVVSDEQFRTVNDAKRSRRRKARLVDRTRMD
jgi:hypothetical protein